MAQRRHSPPATQPRERGPDINGERERDGAEDDDGEPHVGQHRCVAREGKGNHGSVPLARLVALGLFLGPLLEDAL